MKNITEQQYRSIARHLQAHMDPARIAALVGVSRKTVLTFMDGQVTSPIGMQVFEETTRPSGVTKEQHEAWLAENGYRGWAKTLTVVQ